MFSNVPPTNDARFDFPHRHFQVLHNLPIVSDCFCATFAQLNFFLIDQGFVLLYRSFGLRENEVDFVVIWEGLFGLCVSRNRLRRSRKMTHFCSVRVTHLKNKISV